jgi:hypothetical protein
LREVAGKLPENLLEDLKLLQGQVDDLMSSVSDPGEYARRPIPEDFRKAIKEPVGRIYEDVFKELEALRQTGKSFRRGNPELFEALSLANRLAFKYEQFRHFSKHRSVGFLMPFPERDEIGYSEVKIFVWPNIADESAAEDPSAATKNLDDVKKEIQEEYDKVKELLCPEGIRGIALSVELYPMNRID